MKYEGIKGKLYVTGREIGKGGEGQVFDLPDDGDAVLKVYNEPIDTKKQHKLLYMVSIKTPKIESYAAWPQDIVADARRVPCGFTMRKLNNYVPLHMLFSPMDRKRLFPQKGYNFLVHVARNLAIAFHKFHEEGLIVGDVNEGNILVNESGMIAFIDCDSFQVKQNNTYYFCEVGVPRYTPSELLKQGTFDKVVRTTNTDSFSLAILIFQLLFLGRHPFAGKNNSTEELDEEKAIRQMQFAYSLKSRNKKLAPPNNSFAITNLPVDVADLFHRAFEQEQNRPLPEVWAKAMDNLIKNMSTCAVSKLHSYPGQMHHCPWCAFKNQGILYFLDNITFQDSRLFSDLDSFVNGFRIERLEIPALSNGSFNQQLIPTPIDQRFYNIRKRNRVLVLALVIACIGLAFVNELWIAMGFVLIILFRAVGNPTINKELIEHEKALSHLKQKYDDAISTNINFEKSITHYNEQLAKFSNLIDQYRNLPTELENRKRRVEEEAYDKQLIKFLHLFSIKQHTIPSFGNAKKQSLYDNGIFTAADINKLATLKVPGIGPVYHQRLLSWQRQVASQFVYFPNQVEINAGIANAGTEVSRLKAQLDQSIKTEYQNINYQRSAIQTNAEALNRNFEAISLRYHQATLDTAQFRKLRRF